MRKVEYKICKKCKKMYRFESGGIIMTPQDYMDKGLCEECRGTVFKRLKPKK